MRARAVVLALVLASCTRSDARTIAPPDAAASSAPATATARPLPDAATGKAFGAPCVADDECADRVCFHKRLKTADAGRERRDAEGEAVERDGYCSMRCRDDAECPVPPTRGRCGARGMCKRPE